MQGKTWNGCEEWCGGSVPALATEPAWLEFVVLRIPLYRRKGEALRREITLNRCRLQAEWAPLWETSGYHLSGCGADCSTTLGIKPVRRLDSRPLRDCRADQGRIDSLSGPGPMFR